MRTTRRPGAAAAKPISSSGNERGRLDRATFYLEHGMNGNGVNNPRPMSAKMLSRQLNMELCSWTYFENRQLFSKQDDERGLRPESKPGTCWRARQFPGYANEHLGV